MVAPWPKLSEEPQLMPSTQQVTLIRLWSLTTAERAGWQGCRGWWGIMEILTVEHYVPSDYSPFL